MTKPKMSSPVMSRVLTAPALTLLLVILTEGRIALHVATTSEAGVNQPTPHVAL